MMGDNAPMKRAIIYARVSTTDQKDNGYSLPTQRQEATSYAASMGYTVVGEYQDDITGDSMQRPGLDAARSWLRDKKAHAFIAHSIDRIGRDEIIIQMIIRELDRDMGIEVYTVKEGRLTAGNILTLIYAWRAKEDKQATLDKLVRGRRGKAQEGRIVGAGEAPYGYRFNGYGRAISNLEIIEDEAQTIRAIFDWYVNGVSLAEIARRLSDSGIPSWADKRARRRKQNGIGQWSRGVVHHILTNATYSGEYRHFRWHVEKTTLPDGTNKKSVRRRANDDCIVVPVPPIIATDVWQRAQSRLAAGKDTSPRNTQHPDAFLFRRRVVCACGYSMLAKIKRYPRANGPDRVLYRYVCKAVNQRVEVTHDCDMMPIDATLLDNLVWHWMIETFQDRDRLIRHIEEARAVSGAQRAELEKRIEDTNADLANVKRQSERLLRLYTLGEYDHDEALFLEHRRSLDGIRERYQRELEDLENQLAYAGPNEDEIHAIADEVTGAFASEDDRWYAAIDWIAQHATPAGKRRVIERFGIRVRIEGGLVLVIACALPTLVGRVPLRSIVSTTLGSYRHNEPISVIIYGRVMFPTNRQNKRAG